MMNFKSAMSASLMMSLTLGTFIQSAYALPPQSPISIEEAHSMNTVLKKIQFMNQKDAAKLFDVKNHKGESIFVRAHGRKPIQAMQKNLWATLDPAVDAAEGTSTEKVYQNFKIPRNRNEIIVAVIDSGVDIKHEDLKGHVWTNYAELNGLPGVDDDQNGYVDDVHGWNFLGNQKGENVGSTNLEMTRIFGALKKKMDSGVTLTAEEKVLFDEVSAEVTKEMEKARVALVRYQAFDAAIKLLKANGLKVETIAGLTAVTSTDPEVLNAKKLAAVVYKAGKTSEDIAEGIDHFNAELTFHFNPDFNSSTIIGDNPAVMNDIGYGNNDVTGPDSSHGTHVSGIIAADRLNKFGINGQTLNVKIMSVRAVPDGDERDKDVANAVRYAVDNGARVINMSFGKAYSPNKTYVDDAMKYAEAHSVLLVHAAGNDGKSTESRANNFPNRRVNTETSTVRELETWIEVGASSKTKGSHLPADFSNYGKTAVDVFAPGKDIVSTIPGNKYASFNGTSMASPETAGVAALLLGKYPFATANEVKHAIMVSTNQYPNLMVTLPGTADEATPTMIKFSELSATGGTVNAFQAMLEMMKL